MGDSEHRGGQRTVLKIWLALRGRWSTLGGWSGRPAVGFIFAPDTG